MLELNLLKFASKFCWQDFIKHYMQRITTATVFPGRPDQKLNMSISPPGNYTICILGYNFLVIPLSVANVAGCMIQSVI